MAKDKPKQPWEYYIRNAPMGTGAGLGSYFPAYNPATGSNSVYGGNMQGYYGNWNQLANPSNAYAAAPAPTKPLPVKKVTRGKSTARTPVVTYGQEPSATGVQGGETPTTLTIEDIASGNYTDAQFAEALNRWVYGETDPEQYKLDRALINSVINRDPNLAAGLQSLAGVSQGGYFYGPQNKWTGEPTGYTGPNYGMSALNVERLQAAVAAQKDVNKVGGYNKYGQPFWTPSPYNTR